MHTPVTHTEAELFHSQVFATSESFQVFHGLLFFFKFGIIATGDCRATLLNLAFHITCISGIDSWQNSPKLVPALSVPQCLKSK